ncbi:hypothetical protein M4951_10335 [Blastopirellula sp. J2-11]|uniref:hypothetical protein n=1 Tax=Blastopirellula sp. J2-11 TaxID=2943192 RepID=UPI0021CAA922|nr:hypothetical protein [Blastopirellula sp. J2-11]UUO08696.1 hypothetical protein M4951_10335 [Blastopirellula sp. J2-11]
MLKFRFTGGFLDGLEASNESSDPLERQYYGTAMTMTEGGVIGLFLNTTSPVGMKDALSITDAKERLAAIKAAMKHRYTATDRTKDGADEIITMTYSEHG